MGKAAVMAKVGKGETTALGPVTNDAQWRIESERPYRATVEVTGVAPLIFHRYSPEDVSEKAASRKGSHTSKVDNVESYVYRNAEGRLCIPGNHFTQACINAAKYRKDPRSPRAAATKLFKAGLITVTELCDLGATTWDYLDTRRAVLTRGMTITRVRPAIHTGWVTTVEFDVVLPEYIDPTFLHDVLADAGRFCGVCDNRPSYGRFRVTKFEVTQEID